MPLLVATERSAAIDAPGIIRVSPAHSPKSMSLQRAEQNGLQGFSFCQVSGLSQVGQLIFMLSYSYDRAKL